MPIYKGSTNQGLIYYGSPNTNCLTSVPKNVNLTYNAGVFTVHAGSIITVPYGGGTVLNVGDVIGSYYEVVKVVNSYIQLKLLKDFSDTFGGDTSILYMLTLGFNTKGFMYWSGTVVSRNTSGSTDNNASNSDGCLYFDTTNNIIYRRYSGGTTGYQYGGGINGVWISLPIACHYGTPTKAEQIFDWCGFIGSTAFVLPCVKGLIPNGFNADGTYKSIEFTTDRVLTVTRTWDQPASFVQRLFITNRGKEVFIQNYQVESNSMPTVNDWTVWYNPKENIQRWNNSSNTLTDISQWTVDTTMRYIGEIPSDGTSRITSLVPTTVQPLSTGITISNVYKGSTLVYENKLPAGQIVFEQAAAGTYTITLPKTQKYRLIMVGGGGGGASGGSGHYTNYNAGGGSGGYVEVIAKLNKGSYTVSVGAIGAHGAGSSAGLYYGTAGGNTTAFGFTAGGGQGGRCSIHSGGPLGGAGGSNTLATYVQLVANTTGNTGATSGGSYNVSGGASVYGSYGRGQNAYGDAGVAGYIKIVTA